MLALRFLLDERGRTLGTNEPPPRGRAPRLARIVTATEVASALRADIDDAGGGRIETGPTFLFPDQLPAVHGILEITEYGRLTRHFRGWLADELPERAPLGLLAHAVELNVLDDPCYTNAP